MSFVMKPLYSCIITRRTRLPVLQYIIYHILKIIAIILLPNSVEPLLTCHLERSEGSFALLRMTFEKYFDRFLPTDFAMTSLLLFLVSLLGHTPFLAAKSSANGGVKGVFRLVKFFYNKLHIRTFLNRTIKKLFDFVLEFRPHKITSLQHMRGPLKTLPQITRHICYKTVKNSLTCDILCNIMLIN